MKQIIKIDNIIPDADQPRKFFDATKLAALKKSIDKHGILNPLVVQDIGNGKYMLVDGERRFRAATLLKLKEVPVIVHDTKDEIERIIQQFHIQEMHEGWTQMEKANAILSLAEQTGASIMEICGMLNIEMRTARKYMAFAQLANKDVFINANLPLDWADQIDQFKRFANRHFEQVYEKKMIGSELKKLENILVSKILEGEIVKRSDVTKIKDAIAKDPKILKKIMEEKEWSPEQIFRSTKAKSTMHLRRVANECGFLHNNIRRYLENPDIEATSRQKMFIRRAEEQLSKLSKFLKVNDE